MPNFRLALAQTNPIVGDLSANLDVAFNNVVEASESGANLVLFGEMATSGYPIEDLALNESFVRAAEKEVQSFAVKLLTAGLGHIAVVIGHPSLNKAQEKHNWAIAHNSASVLVNGKVIGTYHKHHLPNYSVFDEYRIFVPGNQLLSFEHNTLKFSILICEDIWQKGGPVAQIKQHGADVVLVLNGSPFETSKNDKRLRLVQDLAIDNAVPVAYVNLVGGQDDLVFDGDSMMVDGTGELIGRAKQFQSDLVFFDIAQDGQISSVRPTGDQRMSDLEQIWNALVLALRDYVNKNDFKSVILGLSGGIDSAVCAAIAVDAIGGDRVYGVAMPSRYSSEHSLTDALASANSLGLHYRTEPINSFVDAFEGQLGLTGTAAENLQARMRGAVLMGLSNAEGHLVLTTGNKSELAVGYSTIYGDSVGGFAPIKDVEKTLVWKLAEWRNSQAEKKSLVLPIPKNSITKPPSAELRPDQTDQDSLPNYEKLDALLAAYLEERLGREELIGVGFDAATVDQVIGLVDRAEWKRRQSAIGPKISRIAFGRDRRLPITNHTQKYITD